MPVGYVRSKLECKRVALVTVALHCRFMARIM